MKIKKINLYVVDLPCADPKGGYTYGGGTFFKQDAERMLNNVDEYF